jgi:CDP-diacylglycerol--glycerol-3-phosphate 3-phosphatidyltransferase
MTTANKISVFRILLVPWFVGELLYYFETGREIHRHLAIVVFALASLSDGVDGYVARRFNQRTELGAILDPIGDKLLLVAGMVLLSLPNHPNLTPLPLWLTVTAISRDLLLLLGTVVLHLVNHRPIVRPHWIGKVATLLQIGAISWALLKLGPPGLQIWSVTATAATGASGLIYVLDGVRQMSASPASAPSNPQGRI